ncbi:N-acetylmuramoyl-L-alanine amidase [Nocardia sp. NBC_01503]|uniref:N-acetylmuramoyl-L-alanine amidase n=1 Tax=Nocardia sp. NBC_01503 TaxID=2975997 RepID=UPI002E7ACD19|nr:N-acetylmuramoyl-L-alanine amidase [Nocardia sp. NBC_01503]WTL34638.1 N-acetylmuramoyl-L-alanine amidase [Nocardia sp. NBC_01503]
MPYRRTKHSYVLPVVTALAITAPLGILALSDSPDIRPTDESKLAAIPAEMAEVALATAPDLVLPLHELTGLNLPDLHLSDLRMLPLPASIKVPPGLVPGFGLPSEIPLPRLGKPGGSPGFIAAPGPNQPGAGNPSAATQYENVPKIIGDPTTPALTPNAVPDELVDKVGAQVKELSRDTPFSMVALTAPELIGTTALIRAKRADGGWGPWYPTEAVDTPSKKPGRSGTEPIYVGVTKAVQILVTRKNAVRPVNAPADAQAVPPAPDAPGNPDAQAPVAPVNSDAPAPAPAANPDAAAPLAPANPDTQAVPGRPEAAPFTDHSGDPAQINLEKLAAILIDPGRGALDENLNRVAAPLPGGGPKVISRAQWGADESLRCEEPTYDDGVNGITVHHTAGRNDYTPAESAGIVRAIYTYHAKTLGWCDIGYNALVDKYGQIFEGRFGGLDRPVEGAHAGGFNINTAGVAFMGNHEEEPPTEEAIQAMGNFIGWRSKVAGIDPEGKTTMYSEGSDYTRYALGQAVQLPNIFAHRDVGNTTCPGDLAYDLMDRIRSIAESVAGKPITPSTVQPQRPTQTRPQRNANNQQPQSNPNSEADLATLADLTTKLLGMLDTSPVAKYYQASGGPNGPMGQATSEPQPTGNGGQYAQFVNGYLYSGPDGQVFPVVGKILERFLQLGAGTGMLGLPTSGEYPVQDGVRTDFQNGSLIFSQLTGIVTTVLQNLGGGQNQGPAPIPAVLGDAQQAQPIPAAVPEPAAGP